MSSRLLISTFWDWARQVRRRAFLSAAPHWPLDEHLRRFFEPLGLGPVGFRRLFDAVQTEEFRRQLEKAPLPEDLQGKDSVYLVITTKCNNGVAYQDASGAVRFRTCAHCLNGSGPHGISMTPEEVTRTVAHLPYPLREVEISGGEVLHPEVIELTLHTLRLCRERFGPGTMISLQTSGDFLRSPRHARELVRELKAAGLRRLVIASMDLYHGRGATPQEKFEERKRHYARVAENLRIEKTLFVGSEDYGYLPPDPEVLTVHFFGADIQHCFRGFIVEDLAPNARALRAGLVSELDRGVRYCRYHAGGRGFLGSPEDDQVAINGGPIYPCCWFTEYPLGDARERPVARILLDYLTDPLALAIHLGAPERAWEIARLVSPELGEQLREVQQENRRYNECIACRRTTQAYRSLMLSVGGEIYQRLWPEIPVPWNHKTDPEAELILKHWISPPSAETPQDQAPKSSRTA